MREDVRIETGRLPVRARGLLEESALEEDGPEERVHRDAQGPLGPLGGTREFLGRLVETAGAMEGQAEVVPGVRPPRSDLDRPAKGPGRGVELAEGEVNVSEIQKRRGVRRVRLGGADRPREGLLEAAEAGPIWTYAWKA